MRFLEWLEAHPWLTGFITGLVVARRALDPGFWTDWRGWIFGPAVLAVVLLVSRRKRRT